MITGVPQLIGGAGVTDGPTWVSIADLNRELGLQWAQISNGYGKLKEQTFRVAHMGDDEGVGGSAGWRIA